MPARVRGNGSVAQGGPGWNHMFPGSRLTGPLGRSEDRGFRVGAASTLAMEMGGGVTGPPGYMVVSTSP